MSTDHYAASVEQIDRAEQAHDHLTDLYRVHPNRRDDALIGRLNVEKSLAVQLAGVHATLAVAQQLVELRRPQVIFHPPGSHVSPA